MTEPLPAAPTPHDDLRQTGVAVGDVLAGKYKVDQVLGAGGMGVVVRATHQILNSKVAMKFLLPEYVNNTGIVERFLREAKAAVSIKNPHVAGATGVPVMTPAPSTVKVSSSPSMSMTSHSDLFTMGMVVPWVEGIISSYFLPVKMSVAVKLHLACPCFPVLETEMLRTLQGWPLIIMNL